MKGSIKINWRKNIRLIGRLRFNQGTFVGATWGQHFTGCKLGTANNGDQFWRWREEFEGEKYCVKPVHQLCLSLNMTGGARIRAPSPPELHHISPLFLSLPLGPTRQELISFPAAAASSLLDPILSRKRIKNGKRVKQR
jgi:hypothetical protein